MVSTHAASSDGYYDNYNLTPLMGNVISVSIESHQICPLFLLLMATCKYN